MGDDLRRNACKIGVALAIFRSERKRHQRWASRTDAHPKLFGDLIAERRSTHLRDGQAAGRDDERRRTELLLRRGDYEFVGATNFGHTRSGKDLDMSATAFLFKHRDDLARRVVTEELPESFLVISNAMLFDERDEIGWCVARQC